MLGAQGTIGLHVILKRGPASKEADAIGCKHSFDAVGFIPPLPQMPREIERFIKVIG